MLGAPTLAVVGRYDWVTPVDAVADVAAEIAGTRLLVLDRAGHNPWAERPRAVGTAVSDFVASCL